MAGFFKRMLVVVAGVVLGMAVVAGIGPLRHLLAKNAERPAPQPLQGERAPDIRA